LFVALYANPTFSRENPELIFYPFLCFFLGVTVIASLGAFGRYFDLALNCELVIFFNDQFWLLFLIA
jgi:hypothetical protein